MALFHSVEATVKGDQPEVLTIIPKPYEGAAQYVVPNPNKPTSKADSFQCLSAVKEIDDEDQGHDHEPSLPFGLLFFVFLLAVLAGFVVVAVHAAILYSGCPLGINACNEFHDYEEKGFFLIRWIQTATGNALPEDLIYIIVACLGALAVGQIMEMLPDRVAFQVRGGGTAQALMSTATGNRISLTSAAMRIVVSTIFVGTGGTLGMEGPAIQVCTSVLTFVGWVVGIRAHATQSLLASLGFSCGFAASFNSPLAGILFAMEELQHVSPRLSRSVLGLIIVAAVVSTAVVRACHGNLVLFHVHWDDEFMESVSGGDVNKVFGERLWMMIAIPIGVVCSIVGFAAVLSLRTLHRYLDMYREVIPARCSLLLQAFVVASIGSVVFQLTGLRGVWGIGAGSLQKTFDGKYTVAEYAIFGMGKLVAALLSLSVRAPGDILEPTLITGGFVGGAIGRLLSLDGGLGEQVVNPCTIMGMVALFASLFRFPLTPVVIVFELTGIHSYSLVLPAALASFTAITVSNRLCCPVLDEILRQDGIDLHILAAENLERGTEPMLHSEECSSARTSERSVNSQSEGSDDEGAEHPPTTPPNPALSRRSSKSKNTLTSFDFSNMFADLEEQLLEQANFSRQRTPTSRPQSPILSRRGSNCSSSCDRRDGRTPSKSPAASRRSSRQQSPTLSRRGSNCSSSCDRRDGHTPNKSPAASCRSSRHSSNHAPLKDECVSPPMPSLAGNVTVSIPVSVGSANVTAIAGAPTVVTTVGGADGDATTLDMNFRVQAHIQKGSSPRSSRHSRSPDSRSNNKERCGSPTSGAHSGKFRKIANSIADEDPARLGSVSAPVCHHSEGTRSTELTPGARPTREGAEGARSSRNRLLLPPSALGRAPIRRSTSSPALNGGPAKAHAGVAESASTSVADSCNATPAQQQQRTSSPSAPKESTSPSLDVAAASEEKAPLAPREGDFLPPAAVAAAEPQQPAAAATRDEATTVAASPPHAEPSSIELH